MPTFRFNARAAFITYPQCSLDKESLANHAISVWRVSYVLVSKELHADGHAHLHALLKWDKKFDTRNERYFDIDSFHPNVQACKSIVKTSQYIKKDGDWMEKGEVNTSNYDLARGM